MPNYSALIDPTAFGIIADYLRDPFSLIDYVLHVKSADSLAPLAEVLDRERHRLHFPPWRFPEALERGLAEGSILISSRHRLDLPDPCQLIDPGAIPRVARCRVLYLPPFYIVHTRGLFEGTLFGQEARQKQGINNQPTLNPRLKY